MNKGLSEKMLGFAEKSPYPIEIKHDNGNETIIIGYNQQTGKYGISFTMNGETQDMKMGTTKEDMISYMTNPSFEADMSRICHEIEEKEKAYNALRQKLMKELDEIELPEEEKKTVQKAVEYLTTMPEFTTSVPRIGLGSQKDGEYVLNQYVRVGNEYDRAQGIALQYIQRVSGPSGSTTDYKKMELKDFVGKLKTRKGKTDKEETKKETRGTEKAEE